jgi:hypothetical protein
MSPRTCERHCVASSPRNLAGLKFDAFVSQTAGSTSIVDPAREGEDARGGDLDRGGGDIEPSDRFRFSGDVEEEATTGKA